MRKEPRLKEGQAEMSLIMPRAMMDDLKEESARTEASVASLARRAIKEFIAREKASAEKEKAS